MAVFSAQTHGRRTSTDNSLPTPTKSGPVVPLSGSARRTCTYSTSHSSKASWRKYSWRVNWHDIWLVGQLNNRTGGKFYTIKWVKLALSLALPTPPHLPDNARGCRAPPLPHSRATATVLLWNMPTCSTCRTAPPRPRQRTCAACHAAWMRANRPRHAQLSPEQRQRANCRAYTLTYQRRGVLPRGPCEACGADPAGNHHPDYTDPRHYIRLCADCHRRV